MVIFGREPTVPIDLGLRNETIVNADQSVYLQESFRNLRQIWNFVKDHISKAQIMQKYNYDSRNKTNESKIEINDLVMILKPPSRYDHKFKKNWRGPYRVIRIRRPNITVRELKEQNPKIIKLHINKIKKFVDAYTLPLQSRDEPRQNKMIRKHYMDPNIESSEESEDNYEVEGSSKVQIQKRQKMIPADKNVEISEESE